MLLNIEPGSPSPRCKIRLIVEGRLGILAVLWEMNRFM